MRKQPTQPALSGSSLSVEEFRARIDELLFEAARELERTQLVSAAIRGGA